VTTESFHLLRHHIDRGRHSYRNRAIGFYASALVVLALTAAVSGSSFYRQGPMVLVGILAIAGVGFHLWYRHLSWSRHPVLVALQTKPEAVTRARVMSAHGKAARLNERQVSIGTESASMMLTVRTDDLPGLATTLREHCPSASLAGFPEA